MGYALPPGTIVATQGWSMHRDASIFASPDTFLPERWLGAPENAEHVLKMGQYLMPFGTGTRVCGGQNLAQMMLRIAVATVVRNFDVVAPVETNERSMEIKDSFVSEITCDTFGRNGVVDSQLFYRLSSPLRWNANWCSYRGLSELPWLTTRATLPDKYQYIS